MKNTEKNKGYYDVIRWSIGGALLIGLYHTNLYNYLLFHTLAEGFSIAIACGFFMFAWNTRRYAENNYLLFLGIAYLFIAGLDMMHTLGYSGMFIFTDYDANLPTQLWIAARYMESFSLVIAPAFLRRKLFPGAVLGIYGILFISLLLLIFNRQFPDCFIEGAGLTQFKVISEYIISAILIASGIRLLQNKSSFDFYVFRLIIISIVLTVASELAFTFYISVYGFSNLIGHYFKLLSFYMIYKAVIETGFKKPFDLLLWNFKQAQEELREGKERFRQMFKRHNAVMLLIDPESGMIIDANEAATRFYGYSYQQLCAFRIQDINQLRDDEVEMEMQRALKEKRNFFIFPHQLANGLIRTVEVHSTPLKISNQTMLFSIIHDITERKQAELTLRKSEHLMRTIAQNYPNSYISIINKDLTVGFTSGQEFKRLNLDPNAFIGLSLDDVFGQYGSDVLSKVKENYLKAFEGRETGFDLVLNEQYQRYRVVPFIDENGQIDRILSVVENITKRKRAEEALKIAKQSAEEAQHSAESASQAKSVFLSNMSHELRTPLNAIMGYAQILQRSKEVNADHLHRLRIIHSSGEHLLTLISDILDISKIEAGKMVILSEDIHFTSFLNGVAAIIRPRAEEKELDFTVETDALPEGVRADEFRLRQVLLNLLSNAVKFTEKGGVTLSVSAIGRQDDKRLTIRFEVIDTGVGISPDELDHVFQPFEQAGGILRRADGTGLGLSITQNLVDMMGGKLEAESTPGQGSAFWFELSLPVVTVKAKKSRQDREIIGYSGARRKILIADDKPDNLMVLRDMLEPVGFEVILAENGLGAAAKARDIQPDMILMDLQMPVMNGFEAMRAIRQKPALRDVPIIAVSATVLESDRRKSREAGCDAFLPKPVSAKELYVLMETHLNLTWTYTEPAEGIMPEKAILEPLVPPPPDELAVLHKTALFGDMSAIEKRAAHIIALDERYRSFGEKLQRLAKGFEEKEIQSLVERFMEII